ncbi:hypothetical protein D0Y65_028056 [Glycine soja]|nr:hypothetical protein D0Y65_028056 [Glycine soja]
MGTKLFCGDYSVRCTDDWWSGFFLCKGEKRWFLFISLAPLVISSTLLLLHEPHPLLHQMGWLQSLVSPLKKFWLRLNSTQKKRRGIYILYEDVKSCPYEDVHVLWSILVESHSPSLPSKK